MYPSSSAPNRIYDTYEIHKFFFTDIIPNLCPIISSIGTFCYDLVCFICDLLSPVKPDDYPCKDTICFVSQIKNANFFSKFLVSFDVTSLFNNILL